MWCLYWAWVGSSRIDALQQGNPFRKHLEQIWTTLGLLASLLCLGGVGLVMLLPGMPHCCAVPASWAAWCSISTLCWENWTTLVGSSQINFGKGWEIGVPVGLAVVSTEGPSGQVMMAEHERVLSQRMDCWLGSDSWTVTNLMLHVRRARRRWFAVKVNNALLTVQDTDWVTWDSRKNLLISLYHLA